MPLSHLIGWQMTAAPHLETAGAGAGGGLGAAGDDPQKLAALYRLTDRLFRAETEQDVYEAGLDAMGEAMGCERASILRFDEQKTMRFVAWRGLSASYRAAVDGHTPWRAGQRDVEPIMVADIEAAGESEAITGAILGENIRGLAFFPLTIAGGVVGKFMVYYPGRHDFTAREVAVAVTISRQLGFALERLAAAEILRRERERFEAVIESIPVMIKIYDPLRGELILNRAFTRILGYSSKDAERLDLMTQLFPDEAVIHLTQEQVLALHGSMALSDVHSDADAGPVVGMTLHFVQAFLSASDIFFAAALASGEVAAGEPAGGVCAAT